MRDDNDTLIWVACDDFVDRGKHARCQRGDVFTAGRSYRKRRGVPAPVVVRIFRFNICGKHSLPSTQVDLAQTRLRNDRQIHSDAEDLRGLKGAAQIAAIERRRRTSAQFPRSATGLFPSIFIQGWIRLTLPPPFFIPIGLSMSNQNEMGPVAEILVSKGSILSVKICFQV